MAEVRKYLREVKGFKSIEIVDSPDNKGLASSVISGVTNVLNVRENIIVLEDDLITSPFFLSFMNKALEMYREEEKVISIHGYMFPVKSRLPPIFFLRGADCWGWATWKRGWSLFEPDGVKLLDQLQKDHLVSEFDFGNAYPYSGMLASQIKGLNDSWAVRWYASAFLANKLTLYPGTSLVKNIGLDNTGTHGGFSGDYDSALAKSEVEMQKIEVKENRLARKLISAHLSGAENSLVNRILRKVKKVL